MGKLLRSRFAKILLLAVFVCGNNVAALADQSKSSFMDEINWHGFLSQSFILTDENDFLGSSSDGSFKFNSAGLNASWKATNDLQFSMQGLYKQIGNSEPKGLRLDYAILDWRLLDSFDYGIGVRIGRLKNPFGFFNETRDVAATRPSLLLPESIYIDYFQEILHSSDSFGLYGHKELSEGTLLFNSVIGQPIFNKHTTQSTLATRTSGTLEDEWSSFSRLSYEPGSGAWRTALSYVSLNADFNSADNETFKYLNFDLPLMDGELALRALMFSLEVNSGNWRFISEIERRDIEVKGIFAGGENIEKFFGYYLQLGYQLTPNAHVYIRKDDGYRFKDDKDGSEYKAADPINRDARNAYAKDITVGVTYSPSFQWSFGLEFHAINGTFWLPDLENPDTDKQRTHWNMFLAQVAYRF